LLHFIRKAECHQEKAHKNVSLRGYRKMPACADGADFATSMARNLPDGQSGFAIRARALQSFLNKRNLHKHSNHHSRHAFCSCHAFRVVVAVVSD